MALRSEGRRIEGRARREEQRRYQAVLGLGKRVRGLMREGEAGARGNLRKGEGEDSPQLLKPRRPV